MQSEDIQLRKAMKQRDEGDGQVDVALADDDEDEFDEPLQVLNSAFTSKVLTKSDDGASEQVPSNLTPKQMRIQLPTVARECDRWGISDRSAAAVATAVLQDIGIVSENDTSNVVDRSKIRREREKHRNELRSTISENVVMQGLYFDGRKDRTRGQVRKGSKYYPIFTVEEHIVLLREPGSQYLGHVTPASGKARAVATGIINLLSDNELKHDDIVAIGCDGTNANTGSAGGVIRFLEIWLNKAVHWFVCLLHFNELPLRHLLIHVDGATEGPKSFSGDIGKALSKCCLPVAKFQPVDGNSLPEIGSHELSTDQLYLYQMCKAVMSGHCSPDLSERQPGPISHSRWLTTASRILRLYISTDCPSANVITLVTYIVRVYCPMWFQIKCRPLCTSGALHVWKLISYTRYLPDDLKHIVDTVIQRNAYFCHPENLLLAMMADERPHIRKLAFKRVCAARLQRSADNAVRVFKVPKLIFSATDYFAVIDWSNEPRYEPPLVRRMAQELVESYADKDTVVPILSFPNLPCHTQAVERGIRLVTEACASVRVKQRDGFIRSRIESRSVIPKFEKKGDYRV
jgi:hypothetical protein